MAARRAALSARLQDAVRAIAGGVRIAVRAQPRAARDAIVGAVEDGRGGAAIKVAVRAAPVEGAANQAIARVLAEALGVPPRDVALAHGAGGRGKLVEVRGVTVEQALDRLARV